MCIARARLSPLRIESHKQQTSTLLTKFPLLAKWAYISFPAGDEIQNIHDHFNK